MYSVVSQPKSRNYRNAILTHFTWFFQKKISDILEKSAPKPGVPADLQNLLSQHFGENRSVIEIEELKLSGNLPYIQQINNEGFMILLSSFSAEEREFRGQVLSGTFLWKYFLILYINSMFKQRCQFLWNKCEVSWNYRNEKKCSSVSFYCKVLISEAHFCHRNYMIPNNSFQDAERVKMYFVSGII